MPSLLRQAACRQGTDLAQGLSSVPSQEASIQLALPTSPNGANAVGQAVLDAARWQ